MDRGSANRRDKESRVVAGEEVTKESVVGMNFEREADRAENDFSLMTLSLASNPESLASLLVNMTEKVQHERSLRGKVEKHNHSLLLELDQVQKEVLALRTAFAEGERKTSCSCTQGSKSSIDQTIAPVALNDVEAGPNSWKELLDTKKTKEKALIEAHKWKMQVMELNACISMQHDELAALRTRVSEEHEALKENEAEAKELRHENQVQAQEMKLLHDSVQHLTAEMGKRGTHFQAIMEKWTEAQAQTEHRERETRSLRDQLQSIRQRAEVRECELESLRDERDTLQHLANQLKGAVAAKTAESKAFQAYGASAREHLQSQQAAIKRHAVYRRQVNILARNAIMSLRGIRATMAQTRAPLVAIQGDFQRFLEKLRVPVLTLVDRSSRYAMVAHLEHAPLRVALISAELSRHHLHEQLWRTRQNALVICQLQNVLESEVVGTNETDTLVLRANYSNGELFLRQNGDDRKEVLGVRCDAIFSNRAREWDRHESISPLLQSVLDGCNACVTTFARALALQIDSTIQQTVPELLLRELFGVIGMNGSDARFRRAKVTISFLAVFNETVYDLLELERSLTMPTQGHASVGQQMVVLEVQNAEEALMVLARGREHLIASGVHQDQATDTAPLLTMSLTHTVVTVCLSYENLLTGFGLTKSKLQIVELALGSGDGATAVRNPSLPLSDNLKEVKQNVAVENGVDALVTALAAVRLKDGAFVRYHSSKLTVLLQDTIKPGAKFLALVALPSFYSARLSSNDTNPAAVVRVLQLMRTAVKGAEDPQITSTSSTRDRSLEGFMNRLALQQSHQNGGLTLPFSSKGMQDYARHHAASASSWSTEFETLTKRYGKGTVDSLIVAPPAPYNFKADEECGPKQQHQLTAVHPISSHPPPVPIDKTHFYRKEPKVTRRNYDLSATSTRKILLPSRFARSAVSKVAAIAAPTASAPLTIHSTTRKSLKIRRETASSVLKKAHRNLQSNRFPFR